MINFLLAAAFFLSVSGSSAAMDGKSAVVNPVEAGTVQWSRDIENAYSQSASSGKPLMVLFQEIPGCIGCRTFGQEVLSHPLLAEAIESEFHPVLVYNNRPATPDDEIRIRFTEPAWNYQVIRFFDKNGKDIIPRRDRIWTLAGVAKRMMLALEASSRTVPYYLLALALESETDQHATAGFAMACFWTGEYLLGKIPGVIATEAGWYDNREITLVTYHRRTLPLDQLIAEARTMKCAQRVYLPFKYQGSRSFTDIFLFDRKKYLKASADDQKKQLRDRLPRVFGDMTVSPMQLTKVNSAVPDSIKEALKWLAPSQLRRLNIQK